jgi:hypothetical protein
VQTQERQGVYPLITARIVSPKLLLFLPNMRHPIDLFKGKRGMVRSCYRYRKAFERTCLRWLLRGETK